MERWAVLCVATYIVDDFLHARDENIEIIKSVRKKFVAGKVEEGILIMKGSEL